MPAAQYRPRPDPAFYNWSFPNAPVTVHLYLDAVSRLEECVKDWAQAAGHPDPPGGLLLGEMRSSGVTEITDFQTLIRPGEDGVESGIADLKTSAGGQGLVGYYQIVRGGRLRFDEAGRSLAQTYFSHPQSVFLVIQPDSQPPNAGFFFWNNGRINGEFCCMEFPFSAEALGELSPSGRQPHVVKPTFSAARQRIGEVLTGGGGKESPLFGQIKWLAITISVLVAAVLTTGSVLVKREFWKPAAQEEFRPGLKVERQGVSLVVTWDPTSRVITGARSGVLAIKDGSATREIPLDASRLHSGSMVYSPAGGQVQLDLIVLGSNNRISRESTIAVSSEQANIAKPVITFPNESPQEASSSIRSEVVADPKLPELIEEPRENLAKFTPPPIQRVAAPPSSLIRTPEADKPAGGRPSPEFRTTARPAEKLAVKTRTARPANVDDSAPIYIFPEPVKKVSPDVSQSLKALIQREIEVRVDIGIDENGRVIRANPVSTSGINPLVIAEAVRAAWKWTFQPARKGNQNLASETTLRFKFIPEHAE